MLRLYLNIFKLFRNWAQVAQRKPATFDHSGKYTKHAKLIRFTQAYRVQDMATAVADGEKALF